MSGPVAASGFERLAALERLAEVRPHDPWVRWGLVQETPAPRAWHDPAADVVAVSRRREPYGTSLVLLPGAAGLPASAVRAALALVPVDGAPSLTVPSAVAASVTTAEAGSGPGVGWEWMWTTSAPPAVPGEADVVDLDAADAPTEAELTALLGEHSPRHSAAPGAPDVAGWSGVRRGSRLVACVARLEPVPGGVPLLASLAVHPDARRGGVGAALTAAVTRRALAAGSPAVTLDLYADNDAARRLYLRLGFRRGHAFTTWAR